MKEIKKDGIIFISYEYNEDGTIKLYKTYTEDGTLSFTYNYEYVIDNEIIVRDFDESGNLIESSRFYDLNIDESKVEFFDSNDILTSYGIYNFSGSFCGAVTKSFFESNDLLFSKSSINYFDENCSEIISFTDGNNEIRGVQEITKDDKKWFFKSTRLTFFRDREDGNVIKNVSKNSLGVINEEYSYDSVFEYNDSNYPISEKRTFLNGDIENYSFEYFD